MSPRFRSAGTVVDDPEVRRARLAGVREGTQATIATGTHRTVFARAESLLVAATSATAAARTIVYDAVSRAICHAGVGEGLAVATATGADRSVFHGADLRPRMRRARAWRARPRSIVDDDGTGGENYRQQHHGKPMPRDGGRWKFHDLSPCSPVAIAQCVIPAASPVDKGLAGVRCDPPCLATKSKPRRRRLAGELSRWPMLDRALADDLFEKQAYSRPIDA